MADSRQVAEQLREFVRLANMEANTRAWSFQGTPAIREQKVYEECVGELSDDERDAFERILEKMRRRVGISPPGAAPRT
jgi:hypothetical protein